MSRNRRLPEQSLDKAINYVTSALHTSARLPTSVEDAITNEQTYYRSMFKGTPERTSEPYYEPPMHWHPKSRTRAFEDEDMLRMVRVALEQPPEQQKTPQFKRFVSILNAHNALKQLHRFVDKHQDHQRAIPDPLNIWNIIHQTELSPNESENIACEMQFNRIWVRFLHSKGLLEYDAANHTQGWIGFHRLMGIYRMAAHLLEDEHMRVVANDDDGYDVDMDDPNKHMVLWISNCRKLLLLTLMEMQEIASQSRPTLSKKFFTGSVSASPELTKEKVIAANLSDVNVLGRILSAYEKYMPPFERLIVDLIIREEALEEALIAEHAEDKLINKQVVVFNEETFVNENSILHIVNKAAPLMNDHSYYRGFVLQEILGDISLLNRQRRNFRLLRDWRRYGRPWRKLKHLYDPSLPEQSWLNAGIDEFNRKLKPPAGIVSTEAKFNGITGYDKVARSLLAIEPMNSPSLQTSKYAPCLVCKQPFVGGDTINSTVAVLHCSHSFHFKCIMGFWDAPGMYTYSCPRCGKSPLFNYERLKIHPRDPGIEDDFLENVFGYNPPGRYTPDRTNLTLRSGLFDIPDLPSNLSPGNVSPRDEYWVRENMYLAHINERMAEMDWVARAVSPLPFDVLRPGPRAGKWAGHYRFSDDAQDDYMTERQWNLMGEQFKRDYQGANRQPPIDFSQGKVFTPPQKFEPKAEMAYLRMRRRRADKQRREQIANAGLGVQNLL